MEHRRRARLASPRISSLLLGLVATVSVTEVMAAPLTDCPPGTFSSTGMNDAPEGCVDAPPGYYAPASGMMAALIAPVGTFVAVAGATAPTPAPVGYYVDTFGAVAAIAAPLGKFVDTEGATAATNAPIGTYVGVMGASAATRAPAGTFVAVTGATAPTPVGAGFYQNQTGATSGIGCPDGSYSYGGATACRRITTAPISDTENVVVGPAFNSDRGTGGTFTGLTGNTITFDLFNATTDTASPGNLTDLSIISFQLGGTDAALFSFGALGDPFLSKGEHTTLALQWMGGADQAFSISLTFRTDQDACFAGLASQCPNSFSTDGEDFVFNLSGRSALASPVPEPGTWAIAALGLGLAAARRRRPAASTRA